MITPTWRCDMCGDERPDHRISVLTYGIGNFPGAERNLKYCNDKDECYEKAVAKSRTGKI